MIAGLAVLILALTGCKQYPLGDVPITGGTASQRALVRGVLDEFESATGGGRITLSSVRFDDLPNGNWGSFDRDTNRVRLLPDLSDNDLAYSTQHELCHAIDYADNIADDPDSIWGPISEQLFTTVQVDDVYDKSGPRARRSEALARFCENGPWFAQLLDDRCADDPNGMSEIVSALMEEIWRDPPPLPMVDFGGSGVVVWEQNVTGDDPIPSPSSDPGIIILHIEGKDWAEYPRVDLYTGTTVDDYVQFGGSTEFHGWRSFAEGPWGWHAESSGSTGLDEGPAALLGRVHLWHLGWSAYRLFWSPDGSNWSSAGCTRRGEHIFFADDALWTFWVEGDQAIWSPLDPVQ